MTTIDADAHVLETPETWAFMDDADRQHLPMIVRQISGNERRSVDGRVLQDYWLLDNRIHSKDLNVGSDTPRDSREVSDIGERLRHMDELGIDVQVLYPTLCLRPVARNFRSEYALCTSYNRWLAEIWKRGQGRLRWVAAPPLRSMDRVRDELLFARDNGACGIFMRGLEYELPISDPYFFPLYELAGELDMPICVHSANGSFTYHDFFFHDTTFTLFKLAVVGAFHSLLEKGIPAMFPEVRWGFVEVSAQWVPYVLIDLEDRFRRRGKPFSMNALAENRMYVACEVTDDLPYVVRYAGEDNLMIGTDYGHADHSSEINAIRLLRDDTRLEGRVIDKILDDNARRFYGLD